MFKKISCSISKKVAILGMQYNIQKSAAIFGYSYLRQRERQCQYWVGCSRNKQFFVSVRTKTNRNSFFSGSVSVFSLEKVVLFRCFGTISKLFRNCFETNRSKKSAFRTNRNWRFIHFYVMGHGRGHGHGHFSFFRVFFEKKQFRY